MAEQDFIRSVIEDFHTLTGLSIGVFFGSLKPLILIPEVGVSTHDNHDLRSYHSFLQTQMKACDNAKSTVIAVTPFGDRFAIPYHDSTSGYLLIRDIGNLMTEERFTSSAGLLPILAEYLSRHDYRTFTWTVYTNNFRQWVYDHASEDLTASSLTKILHISKTELYNDFNRYLGMPLARFVKAIRLQKACDLLKATDLSITKISEEVGFTDYNYFCRVFKKELGISAKPYRSLYRSIEEKSDGSP